MALRIPRTVRLPFGYTVKVRQITLREMRDCLEDDEPNADGCWVSEDRTIYLLRNLPITRKRYILGHELQHAVADFVHEHLNDGTGRP